MMAIGPAAAEGLRNPEFITELKLHDHLGILIGFYAHVQGLPVGGIDKILSGFRTRDRDNHPHGGKDHQRQDQGKSLLHSNSSFSDLFSMSQLFS